MKKVLWISYFFPPLNCGVGRPIKLAKYLPNYGWLPVVLSVRGSRVRPIYDRTVVKDIPPGVEVHRTRSLESRLTMEYLPALLHMNPKWLQIPDQFVGWFPFAVKEGLRIVRGQNIDAIFSTSMPNTCHLVAHALKRRTGLPWVADFRDPWTQNTYVSYPSLVLKLENRLEAAVIRNADRITTINKHITRDLAGKHFDQPAEKFVTITHGFDPEDFAAHVERKRADKFVITYTGSLYGRRKVDVFMHALREVICETDGIRDRLSIRFVGNVSPAQKLCHELGLESVVTCSDSVGHQEAWDHLSDSDVILFVLGTGPLDEKASTGKLFEYLAIGRPVLALAPEGEASSIIREANVGVIVNPDDKDGIKSAVLDMYGKWKSGSLEISPRREVIERYNVKALARTLGAVLDEVVTGRV